MIIDLTYGLYTKARVWINELPDACYEVSSMKESWITPDVLTPVIPQMIAIEYYRYVGLRGHYGLLGAHIHADENAQELAIKVCVSDQSQHNIDWSLDITDTRVYAGLPDEYAHGIIAAIINSDAIRKMGTGSIIFDCAAHGEVNSCGYVYEKIASAITVISSNQLTQPTSIDALRSLIEDTIRI